MRTKRTLGRPSVVPLGEGAARLPSSRGAPAPASATLLRKSPLVVIRLSLRVMSALHIGRSQDQLPKTFVTMVRSALLVLGLGARGG